MKEKLFEDVLNESQDGVYWDWVYDDKRNEEKWSWDFIDPSKISPAGVSQLIDDLKYRIKMGVTPIALKRLKLLKEILIEHDICL